MIPKSIKSLILDMDGVIWRDNDPIGNLPEIFNRISDLGLKFAFATNNGTRTPEQYVARLAKYGVHVFANQIVTSSLTLAHLLKRQFPFGGNIFVIGEGGLVEALTTCGFNLVTTGEVGNQTDICAVVMGIDRGISFNNIAEAALLVRRGIPFYGTNPDLTFPTPRGEIPGAGAWISVVSIATNVTPIFAGKPAPELLNLARETLGTLEVETLVVGDRLSTDIAGGQAARMPVALVLTGVSTEAEALEWKPKINFIAQSLETLIS